MALRAAPELHRVSVRFVDEAAERRFPGRYFQDNLPHIRTSHGIVVVAWAFSGLYSAVVITGLHVVLHFGAAIPVVAASLALTYAQRWERSR